jgi:hypothetical protein
MASSEETEEESSLDAISCPLMIWAIEVAESKLLNPARVVTIASAKDSREVGSLKTPTFSKKVWPTVSAERIASNRPRVKASDSVMVRGVATALRPKRIWERLCTMDRGVLEVLSQLSTTAVAWVMEIEDADALNHPRDSASDRVTTREDDMDLAALSIPARAWAIETVEAKLLTAARISLIVREATTPETAFLRALRVPPSTGKTSIADAIPTIRRMT